MNKFNIIHLEKEEAYALSTIIKHNKCPMKCHIPDKKIWWIPKKFIESKNNLHYYVDYSVCDSCYNTKNCTDKKYVKDDLTPVLSIGMPFNCDEGDYNPSIKYDDIDISILDRDTLDLLDMKFENGKLIVRTNKTKLNVLILIVSKKKNYNNINDNNNDNNDDNNDNNDDDNNDDDNNDDEENDLNQNKYNSKVLFTAFYKSKNLAVKDFGYTQTSNFNGEFNVTIDRFSDYISSAKSNIIINLKNKKDIEEYKLEYFFSKDNQEIKILNIEFTSYKEEEKYNPKMLISI